MYLQVYAEFHKRIGMKIYELKLDVQLQGAIMTANVSHQLRASVKARNYMSM